jgi:hypothetical protein
MRQATHFQLWLQKLRCQKRFSPASAHCIKFVPDAAVLTHFDLENLVAISVDLTNFTVALSDIFKERVLLKSSSSLSCNRSIACSNWVLQRGRSWAPSFNFQYLLASSRSSNSCLSLLPRLLVPLIFPSIMCFRRQFLRNMCPIQLAFLRLIVWRMFLSYRKTTKLPIS